MKYEQHKNAMKKLTTTAIETEEIKQTVKKAARVYAKIAQLF